MNEAWVVIIPNSDETLDGESTLPIISKEPLGLRRQRFNFN